MTIMVKINIENQGGNSLLMKVNHFNHNLLTTPHTKLVVDDNVMVSNII